MDYYLSHLKLILNKYIKDKFYCTRRKILNILNTEKCTVSLVFDTFTNTPFSCTVFLKNNFKK